MKIVAFINNRQENDRTSLVYHLAWMYADLGLNVIAADLDPQAGLTGMFLPENELDALWNGNGPRRTVFGALGQLPDGSGDLPHVEEISPGIGLLAGDVSLSVGAFADRRQDPDGACASRAAASLRRILHLAAGTNAATLILADMGPNASALNKAGLTAADHVVVPLAPDLRSLESLRILGPTLRRVQREKRRDPPGVRSSEDRLAGYVVTQQLLRLYQPPVTRWIDLVPDVYREAVAGENALSGMTVGKDPHCLAVLPPFQLLMPLADEARKPMFFLKPADGATGGYAPAVAECHREYRNLARALAKRCEIPIP